MGVELGLAVRDHRVVRVFENRVPMIFYLFDDAVGSSDDIVSHDRMIRGNWIGKDLDGSIPDLIWRTIPKFSWRDWEKLHKTLVRMDSSSGRDLKTEPPDTEAGQQNCDVRWREVGGNDKRLRRLYN
jgi:hypothetical protein